MNERAKKELKKLLVSAAIGFGGLLFLFLVVVPVAQKTISMQMYKIGKRSIDHALALGCPLRQ